MPPRYLVGEGEDGQRLDAALAALGEPSRSQARRWIDEGRVRLNGERVAASRKVSAGDTIDADPPEALPSALVPEALPLRILFEDASIVVVDKAADMVVHPAPGHDSGTLVHALLHHCGDLAPIGGIERPGIVHRLDRGTSGVLVAAKNDEAHQSLTAQFHDHSIERVYQALVRGTPSTESGRVDAAIARHPRDRKRMTVVADARGNVRSAAREAQTNWSVLRRFPVSQRAWLEVRPEPVAPIRSGSTSLGGASDRRRSGLRAPRARASRARTRASCLARAGVGHRPSPHGRAASFRSGATRRHRGASRGAGEA